MGNKATERTKRYQQKVITQVLIKLHKEYDADIIEWLDRQPSKQMAIKDALRKQMAKENADS